MEQNYVKVYTVKELTELLQLHENTVLKLLNKGVIKGFRVNHGRFAQWRVREEELNKYMGILNDPNQF